VLGSDAIRDLHLVLRRLDLLTDWERRPRDTMRVGLEPMHDLMDRMEEPHTRFRSVHVTGTKGKGSVCALVDVGLRSSGLLVGRYTSPHVERINERIVIAGEPVDDSRLARALTLALNAYEAARAEGSAGRAATWFDILTAAAFRIFADAGVDWAVVEVGLGGGKDSTNVVHGEVAVITNVELEHTEVLGSTREAIAAEKAGILKPGAMLITTLGANDEAGRVLQTRARQLGCPVRVTSNAQHETIEMHNLAVAGTVLDALGQKGVLTCGGYPAPVGRWLLGPESCILARLPGRKERLDYHPSRSSHNVPVILDGAHVAFNLGAVLHDLATDDELSGPCVAVVALAQDKDVAGFMAVLCERAANIVCTSVSSSARGLSPGELASTVLAVSPGSAVETIAEPIRAFEHAIRVARALGGWVFVTGSLLLVGEVRPKLRQDSSLFLSNRNARLSESWLQGSNGLSV